MGAVRLGIASTAIGLLGCTTPREATPRVAASTSVDPAPHGIRDAAKAEAAAAAMQLHKTGGPLPNTPYLLPDSGHGLMQSPINIHSATAADGRHTIELNYHSAKVHVVQSDHTVRVEWAPGSSLKYDGKEYDFHQVHFHTPSEHLLDGITYPLEVHMVHTMKDGPTNPPEYLVLGMWFKEGASSLLLSEVFDALPSAVDGEVDATFALDNARLRHATADPHCCYVYRGSLTTPPYTESVTWILPREVREASAGQIAELITLEGNNARHVQVQGDRKIDQ